MADKFSKKELRELRKLEQLKSQNMEKRQGTVKWIAISIISLLFLVFFIGLIINGKNQNKPQTESGKAEISTEAAHVRMGELTDEQLSSESAVVENAKVTLVEYADFQCPACRSYHPVVKELLRHYPNDVKLVFKHFPLIAIHPNAKSAAIAAEAAGNQGKFFAFSDFLYERQEEWAELPSPKEKYLEYAEELGLDMDKFEQDLGSSELEARVEEERNEGITNGVSGTPSFFLNGERIENPAGIDEFKSLIDPLLGAGNEDVEAESLPTATPNETQSSDDLQLQ